MQLACVLEDWGCRAPSRINSVSDSAGFEVIELALVQTSNTKAPADSQSQTRSHVRTDSAVRARVTSSKLSESHIFKYIFAYIYIYVVVDQYSFILEWPFFAEKRYLSRIFRGLIAKHGPTTMSS